MFGTELITGNLNIYGGWNFSNQYTYLETILRSSLKYCFGHKWTNHRIISSTIKFHAGVIFDLWTGYHSFGDQSSHFHHNLLRCITGDGFLVFSIKPSLKEQSFELHDFIGRIIGS